MANEHVLQDHKAGIDVGTEEYGCDTSILTSYPMECLPLLLYSIDHKKPATVINISGRKGSTGLCPRTNLVHGNYAYMCSKVFRNTAVNHLTRILSIEHSDILTVAMCPGWNRTDMGKLKGLKEPPETAPELLFSVDAMTVYTHSGKFWDHERKPILY